MARQVIYDEGGALSTIDGILKEDYVMDKIVNTVNMSTYLLSKLRSEKTTAGRRFVFGAQFGVGEGQGSSGENETLPDEGSGEFEQATGNVRYQYGALYITGQAIEATEGTKAAFVPALKQSLKDCRDGFKLNTQRMSWGDGSGVIAHVNGAVTASTTVPVTNPYGLSYIEADLDNAQKTRPFRRNMKIYFGTADVARTVTAINGDGTLTVDSAVTLVDGEDIIRGDESGRTSANKELRGISEICKDTGTYLGIARAGLPEWQANIIELDDGAGAGGDITEEYMQIALDTSEINGTDEPDIMITEHKTRRRFVSLLQAQKRFISPLKLEGGFQAIEYNGKPLTVDKNAPPQRIYFLRLADIHWMVMKNIGWINRDGTILKWVEKKDAYRAYLAAYRDLVCRKPANQTVMQDITG